MTSEPSTDPQTEPAQAETSQVEKTTEAVAAPETETTSIAPVAEATPAESKPAEAESAKTDSEEATAGAAKVAIGTQRDGVTADAPKAVSNAKENPLGEKAEAPEAEPLPEVRSTIGLSDDETEVSMDDAELASMMDSNAGEDADVVELTVGEKYKGTVSRLHNDDVFFSIKGRFDGVVSARSFKKTPEIGAMLDVVVNKYDPAEGIYELRIPGGSIDVGQWDDLVQGSVVEVKITGSNTGGLECSVNNIRGFIPGSHIDIARVENFGDFVGQKMEVMIQEVNPKKKKLVLSRRVILDQERQERQKEVLEQIEPGTSLEGTVTRLMDFGAFVDIGGVEGLAHVSKLSWDRVNHPKDVVSVGQKVKVKIEKINKETGKISLSVKDTIENPWLTIAERYPEGTVIKGKVTRTTEFGAFVRIEDGIEGLIHISELAHGRVPSVNAAVNVGDEVDVKVLSVDTKKRRIGLSRKATMEAPKTDDRKKDREPAADEPIREAVVKPTAAKLKGGRGNTSGGEQFGLKW